MTLLFDFDQTLGYRKEMWTGVIYKILNENRYTDISIIEVRDYTKTGFPWHDYQFSHKELFNGLKWWEYMEKIVANIFLELGIYEEKAVFLSKKVREKYLDIKKWNLYEETYEVLEDLNNLGYDCHILSNHVPELENIIEKLNIRKYIKNIYNSAFIGYEKPNYKIYQHVINDLKKDPKDIIMIGDNYIADVVGAKSNGINAILVKRENIYEYEYYSENLKGIEKIISDIKTKKL